MVVLHITNADGTTQVAIGHQQVLERDLTKNGWETTALPGMWIKGGRKARFHTVEDWVLLGTRHLKL